MTADQIVDMLGMSPLPGEGGFYIESYRSSDRLAQQVLPPRYSGDRSMGTAIYYLLTPETFSALHKLPTDEIFHFYLGDPLEMLRLSPDGSGELILIGNDILLGQRPQVVVPRDTWQGSRLVPGGQFALLGVTMAPGFDFADYVHGVRAQLQDAYPEYRALIGALTRER
jgi:uncharacterized protein